MTDKTYNYFIWKYWNPNGVSDNVPAPEVSVSDMLLQAEATQPRQFLDNWLTKQMVANVQYLQSSKCGFVTRERTEDNDESRSRGGM